MRVLGIETSCDETAVALYDSKHGLLAHTLFSQVKLHSLYGGVVPEIASRDHCRRIIPLIRQLFDGSAAEYRRPDGVAYTAGPGLAGALMVGAAVGRTLAWAWQVPAVGVHHMEAHLLAPMLEPEAPEPPFVALLVSGGHTQIMRVDAVGEYTLLGQSLDDAAGEAFDKVAKLLDLGYPGGPALERCASSGRACRYTFPRPMVNRQGLDFSFSGLKTFAMNAITAAPDDPQTKADIARAFSDAVVDTLVIKCRRALRSTGLRTLVAAGGVSANQQLRHTLAEMANELKVRVFYPRPIFCTDNGAMIAYAGYLRLMGSPAQDLSFNVRPRWPLNDLHPL